MLKRNDLLSNSRFKVDSHSKIGSGQFAEVYSAIDLTGGDDGPSKSGRFAAIKIESEMKTTRREAAAMRHLLGGKGIVEIYEEGVHERKGKEHPFIAMQLVGENLADLRREIEQQQQTTTTTTTVGERVANGNGAGTSNKGQQQNRPLFSEITIARIAMQTIDALGYTHTKGYVHRDVKPGNICIGRGSRAERSKTYLIDFGLARRYKDEATDKVIAEREDAQFRGTTTYASANAMENREQSPRDDLFSLLYILVELYCGSLPWKRTVAVGVDESEDANYKVMAREKKLSCKEVPNFLCELAVREDRKQLPKALAEFSKTISQLKYGEVPDYDQLKGLFSEWEEKLLNGRKSGEVRMDWDREVAVKQPSSSVVAPSMTTDYNNDNNERKRERSPDYNLNTGAEPYHPQQFKRPNITNSPTPRTTTTPTPQNQQTYDIQPSRRAASLVRALLDNPPLPPNLNHVIETFRNMSAEDVIAGIAATCIIIAETAETSRNVDAIDAFLRDARDCIELVRTKMTAVTTTTASAAGGAAMYNNANNNNTNNNNNNNVAPLPQQSYQQHRQHSQHHHQPHHHHQQQQQQQQQWSYNDRRAKR